MPSKYIEELRAGTYTGDYNFSPGEYDVLGSIEDMGGEGSIYQEIFNRMRNSPDYSYLTQAPNPDGGKVYAQQNTPIGQILTIGNPSGLATALKGIFPGWDKWLESLKIAQGNALQFYGIQEGTARGKQDVNFPYAQQAIPELNKAIWDTIDTASKTLVNAGKEQYNQGLFLSYTKDGAGYPGTVSGSLTEPDPNTYYQTQTPSKLGKFYSSLSTPEIQDFRSVISNPGEITKYNEYSRYLQQQYEPVEHFKYDWYEPESWFPKAVQTVSGAALGGGIAGLGSGVFGGATAGAGAGATVSTQTIASQIMQSTLKQLATQGLIQGTNLDPAVASLITNIATKGANVSTSEIAKQSVKSAAISEAIKQGVNPLVANIIGSMAYKQLNTISANQLSQNKATTNTTTQNQDTTLSQGFNTSQPNLLQDPYSQLINDLKFNQTGGLPMANEYDYSVWDAILNQPSYNSQMSGLSLPAELGGQGWDLNSLMNIDQYLSQSNPNILNYWGTPGVSGSLNPLTGGYGEGAQGLNIQELLNQFTGGGDTNWMNNVANVIRTLLSGKGTGATGQANQGTEGILGGLGDIYSSLGGLGTVGPAAMLAYLNQKSFDYPSPSAIEWPTWMEQARQTGMNPAEYGLASNKFQSLMGTDPTEQIMAGLTAQQDIDRQKYEKYINPLMASQGQYDSTYRANMLGDYLSQQQATALGQRGQLAQWVPEFQSGLATSLGNLGSQISSSNQGWYGQGLGYTTLANTPQQRGFELEYAKQAKAEEDKNKAEQLWSAIMMGNMFPQNPVWRTGWGTGQTGTGGFNLGSLGF